MKQDETLAAGSENTAGEIKNEKGILYPVVFFTGMAVIILEIGLTRIFSIALWHHFAFLSISIALFGMGVSGVFLSVKPDILKNDFYKTVFNFACLLSISNLAAFFIFTHLKLDVRNLGEITNLLKFIVFYLFLALPFFFAGCVMSSIMSKKSEIVQKLYFWDLIGAGSGCLAVVFLIGITGGQGIVILSSLMSAAAAFVLLKGVKKETSAKFTIPLAVWILALIAVIPFSGSIFSITLPADKALSYYQTKGAKVVDSVWNSFSRVDAFTPVPEYTWGLSHEYKGRVPDQIGITIDGDGFTSVVRFDGDLNKIEFPLYTLSSIVHNLNGEGDALIIGAGGGIDVLSARKYGAKNIDAVEINPAISGLASKKYRDYGGKLFEQPGINLFTAEGRNFIKRTQKQYNLVYLPLVDSWAATYSGAYSLSENYLYTIEAFRDYYNHVNPGGYISISRWEHKPGLPVQSFRLCALAVSATGQDLRNSVVITSQEKLLNFIWKKGDFTPQELEKIKSYCERCKFNIIYLPGMQNDFTAVLNPASSGAFTSAFPFDISSVSDDRPFFYLIDRWNLLPVYFQKALEKKVEFPVVFTITFTVLILSIVFSVVFMLIPLKAKGIGNFTAKSSLLYMIYFGFLGAAFMFVEITLMTKFSLFLGHPSFSLSVVLFALLVFTGAGSYLSAVVGKNRVKTLIVAAAGIALLALLYYFALDKVFSAFLSLSITLRVIISVLLISPFGIFMGMPFPTGLRTLGEDNSTLIPWAWGVNGAASVLGSVLAMIVAQASGFGATLLFAALMYVVCAMVFFMINSAITMKKI
ncbi:MAG: hypothetical protein LWY06_15605 [Firmicutes bacterium]|nr:hypothetical protein [Bacillota bacterium]